ncbi:MAG TPA: protein TolR [Deltaproteobacteria bacterium]|nr:protein TolR [Deltaproteobacteria bacterium]
MEFNEPSRRRLLSTINVTPLVDVMLVLLIIFMVTAPMLQEGIEVNLPEVEAAAVKTPDEPLIVTIDRKGALFLNDKPLSPEALGRKLAAIAKRRPGELVLLRADREVPYGEVAAAMARIRRAGIVKIGMVTEHAPQPRP